MSKIIKSAQKLKGNVHILSSKSDLHRTLICASLSDAPCKVSAVGDCDDIKATIECLENLGAKIIKENNDYTVTPIDFDAKRENLSFNFHESGSTARFFVPVASALCQNAHFSGEGRLPERPFLPLTKQLSSHGANFSDEKLPMSVMGGNIKNGTFNLPGNVSSQFVSGILLMLALLDGESEIVIDGNLESKGYVDMTLDTMKKFGINIQKTKDGYFYNGKDKFTSPKVCISDGDWSSAAFWLCAGALGADIRVSGLNLDSKQGDKRVLQILSGFGAQIEQKDGYIKVCKTENMKGFCFDASDIPDLVPVLCVVAGLVEGKTEISGISRLKLKESDRVESTKNLVLSLGGNIWSDDKKIVVEGVQKYKGGKVKTYGDHRIAMSAAVASIMCENDVEIDNENCVSKSYDGFFCDFESLIS